MEEEIKIYFAGRTLDIRQKGVGHSRFIDQKVTPDVLSFIGECILNLGVVNNKPFTTKDIWESDYFIKNAEAIFGKPSPENESAKAEYDKFIGQPLKALAYAGVLIETKVKNRNTYVMSESWLLEFIARHPRHAWIFLVMYLEKVLSDSGFMPKLEEYREKGRAGTLTSEDYDALKTAFQKFIRGNTEINTDVEINRVFPKVLNPYAAHYQIPGSDGGRMSVGRFNYADLMYNRENFRDIQKDKRRSRHEARQELAQTPDLPVARVGRAKGLIRRYHTSSEVKDSLGGEAATQVHHIFRETDFPEISDYTENMVLLTPQQHNTRAHPNNNHHLVDPEYQKGCLLAKIDSIEQSLGRGEELYSKELFIHVLNVGYGLSLSTTLSFGTLRELIGARR